jgi:hypothetical protein
VVWCLLASRHGKGFSPREHGAGFLSQRLHLGARARYIPLVEGVGRGKRWRKLAFWIFAPPGLAFAGSIALLWYHHAGSPAWALWGNVGLQLLSHLLTALSWGRWQANPSEDPLGPGGPYLAEILWTHWVRTLIENAYALVLFGWMVQVL